MAAGKDLLRIEGLSVTFPLMRGMLTAVDDASLRILPGKVTALVGESGSGKSVIGQAIMGLAPAAAKVSGRILFDDGAGPVDILKLPRDGIEARAIRGARIGQIFQEPMTSFSPLHTIGDQVSEVLKIHEPGPAAARRRETEEMLRLVGFDQPGKVFDKYPFELSGGMRQRAMIAMALICRPSLLIADEPTTALDVTIQAQIMKLLGDLQRQLGMAVLLITHDLGVVANSADEVVVIYHGRIMEAGPVEAIFCNPTHAYLKGLLGAIPHFDMGRSERLKPLREIETLGGGLLAKMPGKVAAPTGKAPEVLLKVRGLSKTFGSRKGDGWLSSAPPPAPAVDDVGFDIRRGECLGLVGESGCGKTTVSKMLMRAVSADAGEVTFDNGAQRIDVLRAEGAELRTLQRRIQMIFQDPVSSLSPRMSVGNILLEPMEIHDLGTRAERVEAARVLLKAVGLEENALRRYPHSFSGGQRQRIGIARALALSPELIICDEPVSALDVSVQAQVLNLLKDLQRDIGLTYLFISHNLAVVNYMADRVAVMWAGRIVELAPVEVLMSAPVHPYTRALLAAVPYPDLGRPLDFATAALSSREARKMWAPAFREGDGGTLAPADLGNGHFVLARTGADAAELRA
ncbi:ABC transporter ATP-binding protein [Oceaniglobus roseus]|uniref:ABC transporter ATP-binding protein n=1 Tax=Oceaniglobus roseus TaxID=1737570 RepID=UPI000C7F7509|nr:ABC transporter ATP-binding protein [Kandeliimicrobium roseum]